MPPDKQMHDVKLMPSKSIKAEMILKYFVHFQTIKWQLHFNFPNSQIITVKDLHTVFSWAFTNNFESYHYFLQFDWLFLLIPGKLLNMKIMCVVFQENIVLEMETHI